MTNLLEVEFRIPGAKDFSFAHIKITSSNPDEMREALGAVHELGNLSKLTLDQITGNVDKAAHDLVTSGLGGQVISVQPVSNEPTPPWLATPAQAAPAPWTPTVQAPATTGWQPPAAPVRDHYLVEVPRDKMELWSGPKGPDGKAVKGGGLRGQLQGSGIKIDWDGEAKRNTIPKDTDEGALAFIRGQGITLS